MKDCIPCTVAFYQEVCRIFFFFKKSVRSDTFFFYFLKNLFRILTSFVFIYLVTSCGLQDLSSLTRDQSFQAYSNESEES